MTSTREFNPFTAIPLFAGLALVRTRRLILTAPIMLGALIGATLLDGTTGNFGDFRPIYDIRLAFGATGVNSPPSFPLTRDAVSVWLLAAIVLTFLIVHRQWRLMSVCVRDLERNGAIAPLAEARPSRLLKAGNRLFPSKDKPDSDALESVMRQAREYLDAVNVKLGWMMALFAFLGAALLMFGEYHGLFSDIAPAGLSGERQSIWITHTYGSWWASIDHTAGALAYMTLAAFALYVVALQNVVGVACCYFVLALPKVAYIDADWLNRDGLYGWRPIALVFRTVYWSLILHGITLAIIVAAIGSTHLLWIAPLLLIWIVATPLYIGGSILVFARVERIARARRVVRIEAELQQTAVTARSSPRELTPFLIDLDRTAQAQINPLRLGTWRMSGLLAAFVFPIVITGVQIALT